MAACGSLQHIFENPLPENPTLIESLSSWNQIKSVKPIEQSSFTELFGELHFKENSESSSFSSSASASASTIEKLNWDNNENKKSPSADSFSSTNTNPYLDRHKNSNSFSSMNSESLQLCTEGLGFESSDDVEDFKNNDWQGQEEKMSVAKHSPTGEFRKSRSFGSSSFPPPISCIGRSGKPWVCFKSFRQDGRFVLKEMRIPTQEVLHACREDGRLKLHFVQPDDEILEGDEEEDDQDNVGVDDDDEEKYGNDEDSGEKGRKQG